MNSFTATFLLSPLSYIIIASTWYLTFLFFKMNRTEQEQFILHPYSVARSRNIKSLFTSMMIHANWEHFFFNMFSFYFFAPYVEQIIGTASFFSLYLLSGVAGSFALVIKYKNKPYYTALGASGAVSGVVYAFIVLKPMAPLGILFIPFHIPAFAFGIIYLIGSFYLSKKQGDHIAHEAHIGGALFGALYMVGTL